MNFRTLSVGVLLCGLFVVAMQAADDLPIYTLVSEAPASYELQGEYVGKINVDGAPIKYGAQVIAMGNDEFHAVSYLAGLPGDGWKRGETQTKHVGTLKNGKIEFAGENYVAVLTKGQIEVISDEGESLGTLRRVIRESPTAGAKPPADAIVLFDGKSADQFNNGKIVQDRLLLADCSSKMKFGDHKLHLEFRTPFKPEARGQGRGNSGMYVQSRYEVQVLDSFGLDGKSNECGGIYKVSEPRVNMCFPPLTWQTYDVDFTAAKYDAEGNKTANARITVKHNGVTIHEDLELPHSTPGRHKESPEDDALYLQGHGNPVVYRNIWVVKK